MRQAVAMASPVEQAGSHSKARSWNIALLLPDEPGRRNRRPLDATLLFAASLGTALAGVIARLAPAADSDVVDALDVVLGWAPNIWRVTFTLVLSLAILVLGDIVLRRRLLLARDVIAAMLTVVVAGSLLGRIVDHEWFGAIDPHLFSNWGF